MVKLLVVGGESNIRDEIIKHIGDKAYFDIDDIEFVEDGSRGISNQSLIIDELYLEKEIKKSNSYHGQQRDLRFMNKRKKR